MIVFIYSFYLHILDVLINTLKIINFIVQLVNLLFFNESSVYNLYVFVFLMYISFKIHNPLPLCIDDMIIVIPVWQMMNDNIF